VVAKPKGRMGGKGSSSVSPLVGERRTADGAPVVRKRRNGGDEGSSASDSGDMTLARCRGTGADQWAGPV
jgi:hypothetical protein